MVETSTFHPISDVSTAPLTQAHRLPIAVAEVLPVLEDCVRSIEYTKSEAPHFHALPSFLRGAAVLAGCHIRNGQGERASDLCEHVFSYARSLTAPLSDRVISELIAPIYLAAHESLQTRIAIRCEDIVSKDLILSACDLQINRFSPMMAALGGMIQPDVERLNRHEEGAMDSISHTFATWASPDSPVNDGFNTVPFSFFYHAINSIVPRIEEVGHKREFIGKLVQLFRYQSPRNDDLDNIADACRAISKISGVEVAEQVNQWIPSGTTKSRACRAIALGAIEGNNPEVGEQLLKKSLVLSFGRVPQTVRSGLPLTTEINFDNQTLTRMKGIVSQLGRDSEIRCILPLSIDLAQGMGTALKANAPDQARFFGLLANHVATRLQVSQHKQQYVGAFVDQFSHGVSND